MLKEKTSDVSMTNTNQGSGTAAEAAVPMSHGLWNTWRKNLLLFCLTGVYVELCLHLCVFGSMDRYAGYPVLFGLLGGALCTLVVSSLPKVLRQITGLLLVAAQVMLAEMQLVYHCIFGDFMPVSQIGMGGNVTVQRRGPVLGARHPCDRGAGSGAGDGTDGGVSAHSFKSLPPRRKFTSGSGPAPTKDKTLSGVQ